MAGLAVTADIDLTDHLELVIESGGGSKMEVIPWLPKPLITPYLPDQGPRPQGSNFVHHHHAQLLIDDWLQITAHYMQSWTPNDLIVSAAAFGACPFPIRRRSR